MKNWFVLFTLPGYDFRLVEDIQNDELINKEVEAVILRSKEERTTENGFVKSVEVNTFPNYVFLKFNPNGKIVEYISTLYGVDMSVGIIRDDETGHPIPITMKEAIAIGLEKDPEAKPEKVIKGKRVKILIDNGFDGEVGKIISVKNENDSKIYQIVLNIHAAETDPPIFELKREDFEVIVPKKKEKTT